MKRVRWGAVVMTALLMGVLGGAPGAGRRQHHQC